MGGRNAFPFFQMFSPGLVAKCYTAKERRWYFNRTRKKKKVVAPTEYIFGSVNVGGFVYVRIYSRLQRSFDVRTNCDKLLLALSRSATLLLGLM